VARFIFRVFLYPLANNLAVSKSLNLIPKCHFVPLAFVTKAFQVGSG
jgi:molybdenum cofactor biosynthesis enzyme